jgi:hypothetical protein
LATNVTNFSPLTPNGQEFAGCTEPLFDVGSKNSLISTGVDGENHMPRFRRRIFLIDYQVQGALAIRVVAYWLYFLFAISMLLLWWDLFTGPPRRFLVVVSEVLPRFAPAAVASLLVLPLVVMDVLRLSNRFAGPAHRLENALRELAEGKKVRPLHFRDKDFWQETAAQLNRVAERLEGTATVSEGLSIPAESIRTTADDPAELACQD